MSMPAASPVHHLQTRMVGPDPPPQLSPLPACHPLTLAAFPCRLACHARLLLACECSEARPGRDSVKHSLQRGQAASLEPAAANLMIDRTRAILVYGQERASVSSAIACLPRSCYPRTRSRRVSVAHDARSAFVTRVETSASARQGRDESRPGSLKAAPQAPRARAIATLIW